MNISDVANKNHEELFPNHKSTLKITDPELIEVFDNFAFDEVISHGNLDTRTRLMVLLGSMIANQALSEYKVLLGGALNVGEAHLVGHAQGLEEVGVDGGFPAGELDDAVGHRLLIAQRREHAADLLQAGLVQVAGRVGVGEADRAGEIAAVGEVHVGEHGGVGVHGAQTALVGATAGAGNGGIAHAAAIAETPRFHLQVELDVGVDGVAEVAVLRAGLLHDDLAALLEEARLDHAGTLGAERLGGLGQTRLQRVNARACVGSFRL